MSEEAKIKELLEKHPPKGAPVRYVEVRPIKPRVLLAPEWGGKIQRITYGDTKCERIGDKGLTLLCKRDVKVDYINREGDLIRDKPAIPPQVEVRKDLPPDSLKCYNELKKKLVQCVGGKLGRQKTVILQACSKESLSVTPIKEIVGVKADTVWKINRKVDDFVKKEMRPDVEKWLRTRYKGENAIGEVESWVPPEVAEKLLDVPASEIRTNPKWYKKVKPEALKKLKETLT